MGTKAIAGLAAALIMLAGASAVAADATTTLHALFDQEWERGLRENPLSATYLGDHRHDDRLPDASLEANRASEAATRAALATLHAIDREALSDADRLNHDTFQWQLERAVERQRFREYLIPLTHQGGNQTLQRKVIADVVLPAYERLGTYFDKQYLPACPDAIAASARRPGRAGK
jgi:uncharacterized protein (DUF885 family)